MQGCSLPGGGWSVVKEKGAGSMSLCFFFFWRLFGVKDVGERRKIRETVLGKAREKMRKKKEIMEKMEKK